MTPIGRVPYRLGVPFEGHFEEIFNSNASQYGGEGKGNFDGLNAQDFAHQGKDHSIELNLPPLSVSIFRVHQK